MPHFAANTMALQPKSHQAPPAKNDDETRTRTLQTKNRRFRYLDLHGDEYLSNPDLEFGDPLLYDQLIRTHLTPAEREAKGRALGYPDRLEADLLRSEARLAAAQDPQPQNPVTYRRAQDGSITSTSRIEGRVETKAEALERWRELMTARFLRGEDGDFDYSALVDGNEELDDGPEIARTALDAYLGGEAAQFVGEGCPEGETGVQDF
ncbi:hypothetical protein LTR08_002357 [Meristemomyces frigidus]|nr:hypothetical protein LTR08_002357 [Meristemomyces frigidus]